MQWREHQCNTHAPVLLICCPWPVVYTRKRGKMAKLFGKLSRGLTTCILVSVLVRELMKIEEIAWCTYWEHLKRYFSDNSCFFSCEMGEMILGRLLVRMGCSRVGDSGGCTGAVLCMRARRFAVWMRLSLVSCRGVGLTGSVLCSDQKCRQHVAQIIIEPPFVWVDVSNLKCTFFFCE